MSEAQQLAVVAALPSLKDAEESPISITPTYLDVDELEKGWSCRFFYGGISERDHEVTDKESGEVEIKRLKSVLMIVESDEGGYDTYESAAAMLVSTLEAREKQGLAKVNQSAFSLTFLGKKPTKSGNKCANFSVKPLNLPVAS